MVALKKTVVTTAQLLQFVAHSSIAFDPVYLSKTQEYNRPPGKTNLKQGANIHQPTAWPVPHACAQPYPPGSDSHGQLFCPYWGSSAWHSCARLYTGYIFEKKKNKTIKNRPVRRRKASARLKFFLIACSTIEV